MEAFNDIIAAFGGSEELARAINTSGVLVRQWKRRDFIPPAHWVDVCEAAREREISITVEQMAVFAKRQRSPSGTRKAA